MHLNQQQSLLALLQHLTDNKAQVSLAASHMGHALAVHDNISRLTAAIVVSLFNAALQGFEFSFCCQIDVNSSKTMLHGR